MRAVVVGVDRSPQGWPAAEYGAALAERRRLPILLVHAFGPSQYAARSDAHPVPDIGGVLWNVAERLVADVVDVVTTFHPAVEVRTRLEPGSATEMLLEESDRAAVVVLGSRGTGGFANLVLGSTTLHVAAYARCPVVAVPAPDHDARLHRGVVVGVDGSANSEAAIGYAVDAAAELQEPLIAVHAWYDVARTWAGRLMALSYDPKPQEGELMLAEAMAGWQEKFPDVEVIRKVVLGHPVDTLVRLSKDARMLVVGSRGRGAVRSVLLGSVSHGVLHHARVPVAVVHGATEAVHDEATRAVKERRMRWNHA